MPFAPRRRFHAVTCAIAVGAAALLAACGDDDGSDEATTTQRSEPAATIDTTPDTAADTVIDTGIGKAVDTTVTGATTPSTTPPETTSAPPTSADTSGSVVINVTVGVDSAPDRIEQVPLGSAVELTITNPGADDEFHLHDYDLGDDAVVPAGQPATFRFTADRAGEFALESHVTEDVYVVLRVS